MKNFVSSLFLILAAAHLAACGSSATSSSTTEETTSSTATISMSIGENTSDSSLTSFAVSNLDNDCDPFGEGDLEETEKCITPSSYVVGLMKIELLSCDSGDCTEDDGRVEETDALTIYQANTTDNPTGLAIEMSEGATLSGDDLESITEDDLDINYDGLRFTITYLQQSLDNEDLSLAEEDQSIFGDIETDGLTYRVCTMDAGCPDADGNAIEEVQAGDIMVRIDDEWYWIDQDIVDDTPLTTTRPSNPAIDEGFAHLGEDDNPEGSSETGFLVEMANDAQDSILLVAGHTYEISSVFEIGYAFHFEDTNDNDLFDPMDDNNSFPGRPASISFSAVEEE